LASIGLALFDLDDQPVLHAGARRRGDAAADPLLRLWFCFPISSWCPTRSRSAYANATRAARACFRALWV